MFSIRYAGDIESRRSKKTQDRTLEEFQRSNPEFVSKWAQKQKESTKQIEKLPTATEFPSLVSTIPSKQAENEIDEYILNELDKSLFEEDYVYNQFINEYLDTEPYMEFVDEEEFLQFHFNNDSSFYSE